jgi:predicted cupin superfamily sugar epimerase
MTKGADFWIAHLGLEKHPEGGWFKETFRSDEILSKKSLPGRYTSFRTVSTSIYYLLKGNEFSSFHRLKSDEIWHFYNGSPVSVYIISPSGNLTINTCGPFADKGNTFQLLIPKGSWFAAKVSDATSYTLLGCTVAPGFDFEDFELGKREFLINRFPQHAEIIKGFTR